MLAFEFFLVQLFIWVNTIYFYTLKMCQKKKRVRALLPRDIYKRQRTLCCSWTADTRFAASIDTFYLAHLFLDDILFPPPADSKCNPCLHFPALIQNVCFPAGAIFRGMACRTFFHPSQIPVGCSAWHASSFPAAGHCPKHPFRPNHQVAYLLW